ncbi:hypothetical protein NPX13_g1669 [Xylaria arbuscula]|uniref:Cytochrome P450 n=1 Tax=Xylaria arbuscula TaxID=114810 RepID=A0A9W8NKL6_9PEZI|nr:hypothetical protein NPX13_g1669 [Xylaria arbuscula]
MPASTKRKLSILFGLGILAGLIGFIKIGTSYSNDDVYIFSFIAVWSNVQELVCLFCCCAAVYKPILPPPGMWSRLASKVSFSSLRQARVRGKRSQQSMDGNERLENGQGWAQREDGSSKGLIWSEQQGHQDAHAALGREEYPLDSIKVQKDLHICIVDSNEANHRDPPPPQSSHPTIAVSAVNTYLGSTEEIAFGYYKQSQILWLATNPKFPGHSLCLGALHLLASFPSALQISGPEGCSCFERVCTEWHADIYGSHDKGLETFTKTDIHDFGRDRDGGFIWQQDPIKHHQIAKKLAPAFSPRAMRAKDGVLHKHVDYFVDQMKEKAGSHAGVDLATWVQWLSLDIAADMAYHHEANCMRDGAYIQTDKHSVASSNMGCDPIRAGFTIPKTYPAFQQTRHCNAGLAAVPLAKLPSFLRLLVLAHGTVLGGTTEHVDYFEQLIQDRIPEDGEELVHLSTITTQLMFAGYLPPSDWYYGILFHLLQDEAACNTLTQEIRHEFNTYEDITPSSASSLPYLNACMKEALRLFNTSATINGMPVNSPGATVDGIYIPKGTVCQFNIRSVCRNPLYFKNPEEYRPERWLPSDHPLYNPLFANDTLEAFSVFSQGPRACIGKEVAWWQGRLVIAKTFWSFDIRMLPGQHVDMEKDLRGWGYWMKPKLTVRFLPVNRSL